MAYPMLLLAPVMRRSFDMVVVVEQRNVFIVFYSDPNLYYFDLQQNCKSLN